MIILPTGTGTGTNTHSKGYPLGEENTSVTLYTVWNFSAENSIVFQFLALFSWTLHVERTLPRWDTWITYRLLIFPFSPRGFPIFRRSTWLRLGLTVEHLIARTSANQFTFTVVLEKRKPMNSKYSNFVLIRYLAYDVNYIGMLLIILWIQKRLRNENTYIMLIINTNKQRL